MPEDLLDDSNVDAVRQKAAGAFVTQVVPVQVTPQSTYGFMGAAHLPKRTHGAALSDGQVGGDERQVVDARGGCNEPIGRIGWERRRQPRVTSALTDKMTDNRVRLAVFWR